MIIKAFRKLDELVQARYQAVADYAFINHGIHVYKLGAQCEMINLACWVVVTGFQVMSHDFWLIPLNLINIAGSYFRGKRYDAASTSEMPDPFIYTNCLIGKKFAPFLAFWSIILGAIMVLDHRQIKDGLLLEIINAALISTTYFGACMPLPPSRKKQKMPKGDMAWIGGRR